MTGAWVSGGGAEVSGVRARGSGPSHGVERTDDWKLSVTWAFWAWDIFANAKTGNAVTMPFTPRSVTTRTTFSPCEPTGLANFFSMMVATPLLSALL